MRQRRWLELVKDYDCEILYHPGKANKVADALSRKSSATELDPTLVRLKEEVREGKNKEFQISSDGILHFKGRLCIPKDPELREQILSEAHTTPYSVHPGATKMYKDLKEHFWWPGMKEDVANHDAIWVIVDRLTKSAHFIPIKMTYSLEQLAELYVREIVRLHGVPKAIISDRDA
ncbi:hypothetical protein UlMin_024057 [Ulmus minor]